MAHPSERSYSDHKKCATKYKTSISKEPPATGRLSSFQSPKEMVQLFLDLAAAKAEVAELEKQKEELGV